MQRRRRLAVLSDLSGCFNEADSIKPAHRRLAIPESQNRYFKAVSGAGIVLSLVRSHRVRLRVRRQAAPPTPECVSEGAGTEHFGTRVQRRHRAVLLPPTPGEITEQVETALAQLQGSGYLAGLERTGSIARDLEIAMHRTHQLTVAIALLDGLRGLLVAASD